MVGQTVGKYRVLERIGRGGMGTVYRALDETLDREVAIKVLNPELGDAEVARRFRAEAVTVARLNHPGIATIYELFQHDDQWLMVMEFVRGETLEHLVERTGPLPAERASDLCQQVLTALAHAHHMGVVHRDLKPGNLMLTASGTVKIMDFGIARVAGTEHLTNVGYMMGTPAYMAPEQVLGDEVDARSDLYAIGVVLYRLGTGKLPFKGDTPFAMAQAQVKDPPTPVYLMRAGMPDWMDVIMARALAKAQADRFQTAEEFRDALQRASAGLPLSTAPAERVPPELIETVPPRAMGIAASSDETRAMSTPAPAPVPVTTPAPPLQASAGPGTVTLKKRSVATIGAAAAAVILLLAGFLVFRWRGNANAPAPASQTAAAQPVTPVPPPTATPSVAEQPPSVPPATPAQSPAAAASPGSSSTAPAPAASKTTSSTPGVDGAGRATGSSKAAPPVSSPPANTPPPAAPATRARDDLPPPSAPAVAPPLAAPAPAPAAAPADDPQIAFVDLKVLLVNGRKAQDQDVTMNLSGGQITVVSKKGGEALKTVPYRKLLKATYVHSKDPKWDQALPAPPIDLDIPGVFRSSRHWLALQTANEYVILRLSDDNWRNVLQTVESRTGLKIDRPEPGSAGK